MLNSSMGEVIQFPNSNTSPAFVKNEQERVQNQKRYQIDLCLDTSIDLSYLLLEQIQARGIELQGKELDQHILMIAESIKALMLKGCDIDHPLHRITEQIVNKEESAMFVNQWQNGVTIEE